MGIDECLKILDAHSETVYTLRWSSVPILPPLENDIKEQPSNIGTEPEVDKSPTNEVLENVVTEEKTNGASSSSEHGPNSENEKGNESNTDKERKRSDDEKKGEEKSNKIEGGGEEDEENAMRIENSANSISKTSLSSFTGIQTRAVLASGSEDSTVKLWDTAKGTCLHSLSGYSNGMVYCVAYDNKADYIAVGHADGVLSCGP